MPIPPGPSAPPAIQVLRWIRTPFRVLEESQARFGDAFTMRLPRMPGGVVVVSDPLAVKDVFGLGPDEGHAGKANFVLKPFVGEHSLLLLDGAEHLRHRKMILPAFHGERMHAYGRTMLDVTNDSIDGWPLGRTFPVHGPMQSITLQVILRTVFGRRGGPSLHRARARAPQDARRDRQPRPPFPLHAARPRAPHARGAASCGRRRRAGEILREEIRRGREKGTAGRTDVLAMMLDARDEAGNPLGEDEVHDELVTLLAAGHETTATALAWTLRWILPDRALLARLQEEIASAGGDPQRIAKLELLDATVKESLRLQPVVPMVGRVLQEPARIGSLDLPEGAFVAPSIYLVHRRPSLYPEPRRFRPERFLGLKPAAWEFLPFGGGLRKCVGAAFAIYEMKMVLAAMLPRIEMRLAIDRVHGVRRAVTITPNGGLPVMLTAKRSRLASAKAA